ncbi:amidohydrolase family protein [Oceanibaculum pacificum]|uniref:N-ethylammeline chlorohydrolase n=1 Tax=Oceanibaculum pacificum TaxID=580166 RepID=A0A154WFD0_9PROT|nr:amidohydrolase family protein [Oceanibaculum pacificum]KZD12231.1 N-ethylammeline chlorohydrolase [Oceanibaculum pacificum]
MDTQQQTTVIRKADWVVAWDAEKNRHVYRRGVDIAFKGTNILHVGPDYDGPADTEVDGRRSVVLPGLINIHCHPYNQPTYKGVREELGNPKLYMSALYDRTALFQTDAAGSKATCAYALSEMLLSGVTTVADLSPNYEGWLDVLEQSGLRAYVTPQFREARWDVPTGHRLDFVWDKEAGRTQYARALDIVDKAVAHPSGRLSGIVMPAQIDTCTAELFQDSMKAARARGLPLQTHAAQSVVEFHEMVRRHGLTPIEWLDEIGFLAPDVTIGHGIFLDHHSLINWESRTDLARLAKSGATVAHCPVVFSRYGHTLEHFGKYLEAGVNMAIGTDTHPHNLWEEMRLAATLAKVNARDFRAVTTADMFNAVTIGPAKALGRPDIGRLAPGAKADIVLVDAAHPIMRPLRDPLRSLVYTAAERAVTDVYVDGVKRVENGAVLTFDFAAAAEQVEQGQIRAEARVPERNPKGLTGRDIAPLSLEEI